ncbi:SDR family oxidoreductase [Streptomyces sp. BH097]|uniref:SDR family oxidoreductase n=1 Tax=unclassified Streptomyces TaxID=2593676 RepID=UPI003BB5A938
MDNSLVLVTGGSGHLGSHMVTSLLARGHQVRTTVRSPDRAADVRAMVPQNTADRLEVVTADLSADAGWPDAVAGCTHIVHVASPFPATQPDDPDELIAPARDGALRVLRAACGAGVKRTVLTSSFAAIGYSPKPDAAPYDESDWTDPEAPNTPYVRSKTIAESAAWEFVARAGNGMELSVINPTGIFGPLLGPHLSASTGLVKAMLDGTMPAVPEQYFAVVDVRDLADLHVRAMTHPAAAGERFLAAGGEAISLLRMARILAANMGEAAAKVPARELPSGQKASVPVLNTGKARSVFGWMPRDTSTTIVDTATSLIRLNLVEN